MVKIITDSSSLYTVKEAKGAGIESIPLCVSIGEWHGRDLQMDMKEFYERIDSGLVPTSSQPPIGEVIDIYEMYPGQPIINIAMADGLSGTYQSACSAKNMAMNKDRIAVFNSKTLCGPHRYMVEQAGKLAEEGKSQQEILTWLEEAAKNTESFLIPQDYSFLRRGGRLTPIAAAIGSLLNLKPILRLTEDGKRLDKFGIKRTMPSAVKSVVRYLSEKKLGVDHILYISHANALEDAERIKESLREKFEELEIRILELSPAFVTQGGPRCIAIQYIKNKWRF